MRKMRDHEVRSNHDNSTSWILAMVKVTSYRPACCPTWLCWQVMRHQNPAVSDLVTRSQQQQQDVGIYLIKATSYESDTFPFKKNGDLQACAVNKRKWRWALCQCHSYNINKHTAACWQTTGSCYLCSQ